MPTKTPHFGLQAFVSGDYYSATVDKARFSSIDQHMAFVSDIIGRGRINGWVITSLDSPNLSIEIGSGIGMIDRNITRTFGDHSKNLLDNNFVYIWMKRRPGVIGQAGAFSNIAIHEHSDTTAPETPTNFNFIQTTISSILLEWDINSTNFDFKEFKIYRSIDNVNFELLKTLKENTYLDTDLDDNTTYYYKISSIDFTENESPLTPSLSVITDIDTTPPTDPLNVSITPATNAVHLLWRDAAFGNIEFYRAYVTPVNLENQPTGQTEVTEISGTLSYASIFDLDNGQKYEVKLVSVGDNGVESSGVVMHAIPDFFTGPRDVVDFRVFDQESDGIVSDVVLVVEWESFLDPYDSNPPVAHEIQIEEVDSKNNFVITYVWLR